MENSNEIALIRQKTDEVLAQRKGEIYEKVRECIAETLALDKERIGLTTNLMDLGAESLDFLDLLFRLESTFNIKIPRGGIQQAVKAGLKDGEYEQGGILSDEALNRLRQLMPEVDPAKLTKGLASRSIPTLFTTETFVNLVAWKLSESNGMSAQG
jgi:acyl carrier protein